MRTSAYALVLVLAASAGCSHATPPRAPSEADPRLDTPVGLGLTARDVREGNQALAAHAAATGQRPGSSLDACGALAAAQLVAQCTNLGSLGGGPIDRASFELTDPSRGRGVISHYATRADYDLARAGFATFEQEYGTFIAESPDALLILSGGEAWDPTERSRVRAVLAP